MSPSPSLDQAAPVPDLTVIMPTFNEVERIERALEELISSRNERSERVEIFILDNGSTDGTREILERLDKSEFRVIFNSENLGKGGSIKKAILLSTGRYVVIHDADLEYRAADIWALLDATINADATMGLGSRMIGGKASYEYFTNYLGVRILTWSINLLFRARLTDTATGMKILKGDHARRMNLRCSGFDLDFELVTGTLRLGGTIIETRANYSPRTVAQGKKLRACRDGFAALEAILRDRFRMKRNFTIASESDTRAMNPGHADEGD